MVAIVAGKNGARALFRAEEEDGLEVGNVITRPHSMAEKIVKASDPRWKHRNAKLMNVQVTFDLI